MTVDRRFETMFAEIAQLRADARQVDDNSALRKSGGGGTSGGVTDDWKMNVDRQLTQLHDDIRALLNRGAIAVVALASIIGGQYVYFNTKFEAVNQRLSMIETQQARDSATINGKLDLLVDRLPTRKNN